MVDSPSKKVKCFTAEETLDILAVSLIQEWLSYHLMEYCSKLFSNNRAAVRGHGAPRGADPVNDR